MKELPKIYDPQSVEYDIYKRWEESGYFNPDNLENTKGTHCNILPPPNANGELHLGHSSGYTVMDIFGRWARMNGKKTLLLPGKDHAGIQSQVVFEKKLQEEKGISRNDLGREEFYKQIYDFCIDRADYMRSQEKRLGISADWSREKFTMDPDVLKNALETFVKMHSEGLIYKGKRIINWCPRCESALSDVEVVHKEKTGKLYYIKYPLENSDDYILVATTRPETMLGDSAVAVNPKDERYAKLVGKNIILPLQNKVIPIIADRRIDMNFGTGAVKITPAHDPLDWEIGKDNNLEEIQVINEKAKITQLGGKYVGLSAHEAREKVLEDLKSLDLLEKTEELLHSVSLCERCKTTIEPLISSQWFINVDAPKYSLKKEAIKAIENGDIEVFPESFKKILINWFDILRDWCISRQIWWGPQFPVWYCKNCAEEKYIVSIEKPKECPHCQGKDLYQDENTFDTWFTSSQWPYTTLQSHGDDYAQFYPTDLMVMGRDLLFFWAARMIMMGGYRNEGKVPFKNLFFTGLIRDKEGQKMSKSKGNGIDPVEMIDRFGADAMRMSIIMDSAPGQDSRLYEEKIETFRNFANKLWNISRYCLSQENFKLVENISKDDLQSKADHWIIGILDEKIEEIDRLFEGKQIAVAADTLKSFTWDVFADNYVEWDKIGKNTKVLGYVLDKILRLWHPFMPFITEHIWSLAKQKELLMISSWPKPCKLHSEEISCHFSDILSIIKNINNVRAEYKVEKTVKIPVYFDDLQISKDTLSGNEEFIKRRANVSKIDFANSEGDEQDSVKRLVENINFRIPLKGLIDVEKEKTKTEKEIANLETFIAGLKGRLENKEFVSKAPEQIINQQKETLAKKEVELAELKKHLSQFD